ncbi:MAG: sensor domain-containing diguanylate cyclase [Spirochaeta sp.]|jgi:diguanylate cyclase|nr:sensor domain-containing diguanylate cyclase [Spirochaeta sp.]
MNESGVLDVLPIGVVMINRQFTVLHWNRWMEMYSGILSTDIQGASLFRDYPELNSPSFLRTCRTVFTFGNVVYLSQKLHRYLFPFRLFQADGNDSVEMMQQSCSMTPVHDEDGEIQGIAITVQDVTDSVVLERRLRAINNEDALTGAYNRRFLDSRLAEECDRHQRYGRRLSVFIADLDDFKEINDTHGHPVGDDVLREFCRVTKDEMRRSDFLCRYGGEEFVGLLPETGGSDAAELAERIRRRMEKTVHTGLTGEFTVTVSFGIAELSKEISEPQDILTVADDRLYRAKDLGRNCIVFDPSNDTSTKR